MVQLAVVGVDAFLRRPDIRRRGLRLAAVLLLVAGLGIGWSTSFRYSNLRSGSASWSRTYAGLGSAHDVAPSAPRALDSDPGGSS